MLGTHPFPFPQVRDALGPNGNMLPVDRNVTFLIEYTQGTIEKLLFFYHNASEKVLVKEHVVPDKFNAKDERVNIMFPEVRGTGGPRRGLGGKSLSE